MAVALPLQPANDMQIAEDKELPSSPKNNPPKVGFAVDDEGGGAMAEGGVLSEDEDDDDDEDGLYKDGAETTAPGLVAQVE